MATLVFCKVNNQLVLYHGDDYKMYLEHCQDYNFYKKYEVPSYDDIINNKLEVLSAQEYLENYIINNVGENFKWLYNIHCVCSRFKSEANTVHYSGLHLNTYSNETINSDIKRVNGIKNQSIKSLYKFLGISEKYIKEVTEYMNQKGFDSMILKRGLKFKLAKTFANSTYVYSLIKGEAIEKEYTIEWKKRYLVSYLRVDIPNYYKKEIKTKYIGGTEDEYLIGCDIKEFYPNLYHIEPKVLDKDEYLDVIDIDELSAYNEEQLKYKEDLEAKELEKKRKYEEELERRKRTPKYCSRCGASHAKYVANPYYYEMYNSVNMEWLCDDCYNDIAGDI